jgi:hypothetical protein
MEAAPLAARILAEELGRDAAFAEAQVADFVELAVGYLPPPDLLAGSGAAPDGSPPPPPPT